MSRTEARAPESREIGSAAGSYAVSLRDQAPLSKR
jgi:hypothetical protein